MTKVFKITYVTDVEVKFSEPEKKENNNEYK